MTKRVHKTKAECTALGLLDRPTLRAMRLKPAQGQKPANAYWQGYGLVNVFAVDACVPVASYRAPTAAQLAALAAGRQWLGTIKCAGCAQRAMPENFPYNERRRQYGKLCFDCVHAKRLADRDLSVLSEMPTVYLDTETTGLLGGCGDHGDEIVELCICDDVGQVIINTLVTPARLTEWPEAQEIHGIDPCDVLGAPTLADLMPAVLDAIRGKRVVIYNSTFDIQFFPRGTFKAAQEVQCCMLRFAEVRGVWHDYFDNWRWHKLKVAAEHVGHEWTGDAHRALADVLATRSVWRWLQAGAPPPPVQLPLPYTWTDDDDLPFN